MAESPTKPLLHRDDQVVQDAAEEAAKAACEVLDKLFPGFDDGGITSNYQGHLKRVMVEMLAGQQVLSHAPKLPALVVDDGDLGDPFARGSMFLVVRDEGGEWDEARRCLVRQYAALDDRGLRFVGLADGEHLDPYTSFEAARDAALAFLRREKLSLQQAGLMVLPVVFSQKGYAIEGLARPPAHD